MRAARLTGQDLTDFLYNTAELDARQAAGVVHSVSIGVDGEGVKFDVNGDGWSAGRGEPVRDGLAHVELSRSGAAALAELLDNAARACAPADFLSLAGIRALADAVAAARTAAGHDVEPRPST